MKTFKNYIFEVNGENLSEALFSFMKKKKEHDCRFDLQYNVIQEYLERLPFDVKHTSILMAERVSEWCNTNLTGKEIAFPINEKVINSLYKQPYSFNTKNFTEPLLFDSTESINSSIVVYYKNGTNKRCIYFDILFLLCVKINIKRDFSENDPFGEENWEHE